MMDKKVEYHNTDVAACSCSWCKKKDECLRYHLHLNQDKYQVYVITNPTQDRCEHFVKHSNT